MAWSGPLLCVDTYGIAERRGGLTYRDGNLSPDAGRGLLAKYWFEQGTSWPATQARSAIAGTGLDDDETGAGSDEWAWAGRFHEFCWRYRYSSWQAIGIGLAGQVQGVAR
jgi:hypothetical protein